jgi:hypothetical protein
MSLISRASLVVDNFRVVGAAIGDGIMRQMEIFQMAIESVRGTAAAAAC